MPKNKVHKGLLKRVTVSKTGKVKYKTCASSHLKSHKSANTLLRLRKRKAATTAEAKRFSKLLHRRHSGLKRAVRTAVQRIGPPVGYGHSWRQKRTVANNEIVRPGSFSGIALPRVPAPSDPRAT